MADIGTLPSANAFRHELAKFTDAEIIAQSCVQQGAIHAIGFLLKHGATEETAVQMMTSLRENAEILRIEALRRGQEINVFPKDQTWFM